MINPLFWARVKIKRWLCKHMLLIEFCKTCGRTVDVIFHVRDEIWEKVVGDPGTVRCIWCFHKQAESKRVPLLWVDKDL